MKTSKTLLFFALLLVGCESKRAKEYRKLEARAEQGDPAAMREIGLDIWAGTTGRADEVKRAMDWLEKAAAKGDTIAMYRLGTISRGQPKALEWFKKGAEAGDPNCMTEYAKAYRYGDYGLERNEAEAKRWLAKADEIDRKRRGY